MRIDKLKKYIIENLCKVTSCNEARVEADILLKEVLKISKKDLLLNPDKIISTVQFDSINDVIVKRLERKPIQQILGKAHFMGLEFFVDENTLIPRDETEILVNEALSVTKDKKLKVLDVGTGSGCIACSVAKLSNVNVSASDISKKALKIARENAQNLNVEVGFIESDLFENIQGEFDVIVSNPPYIPFAQGVSLEQEVLNEPHNALFADDNGLYFYRRIIKEGSLFLNEGGTILFEMGIDQSEKIKELFIQNGFDEVKIVDDLAGIPRVISAQKKTT